MRHETDLERRQRMAETAAHGPLLSPFEWELDAGTPVWDSAPQEGAVADLVDHLPEPMRSVVELRIWGRFTYEAIADELGLSSRGHAHVLYTRALDRLRTSLENPNG